MSTTSTESSVSPRWTADRAPRTVVIGLGPMGLRHLRALTALGWPIVGAVDRRPDRATPAREVVPDLPVFDDVERAIAESAPDLVAIVTNGPSHAELALGAIEAGVPLIACEKPMATSVRDCERMHDAAMRSGARLAVNHVRRFHQGYAALREALARGAIGRVQLITGMCGGGGWGVIGAHFFDLTRLLTGSDVVAVSAWQEASTAPNPRGAEFVDPGGSVLLELASGTRVFWDIPTSTRLLPRLTLAGELGTVDIAEVGGPTVVTHQRTPDGALRPLPFPTELIEPHVPLDLIDLTRRFYQNLASDEPLASSSLDGLAAVEVILALYESQRLGGARVSLPLSGPARERAVPIT